MYNNLVQYVTIVSLGVLCFTDGEYGVCLDQRRLRTPLRKLFSVPSKPLAVAVSQEWEAQSGVIQPSLMHLVGYVHIPPCIVPCCVTSAVVRSLILFSMN